MWTEEYRPGKWRGGYRDPAGKRHTKAGFAYQWEADYWAHVAERDANRRLTDLAVEVDAVAEPRPGVAPVLARHAQGWLRSKDRLARATRDNYGLHVRTISADRLGLMPMDEITADQVEAWIVRQQRAGDGSPTINHRLTVLKMILSDAVRRGLLATSPAVEVRKLPQGEPPTPNLPRTEERRLLLAADAELTAMILLALDAGLRFGELVGLPADALTGDGNYLAIHQVIDRADNNRIRQYTKGKRARVVPTTPRLAAALAPLVTGVRQVRGPTGLLFVSRTGTPIDYNNFQDVTWQPLLRTSGVEITLHGLRHTYGSRLAAAGVPRSEIAKLMGHSDETTTARYIHAGDDGRRRSLVLAALEETVGQRA